MKIMLNTFQKLSDKSGQHSIEYAVIMILVMAGMITAQNYVIRSWNANMQSWEDTSIDSMLDPIIDAPDVISLPDCTCGFQPRGCGPLGSCPGDRFYSECFCQPLGCGLGNAFQGCAGPTGNFPEGTGMCECDPAANCCSPAVSTGLCGAAGGCPEGQIQKNFLL